MKRKSIFLLFGMFILLVGATQCSPAPVATHTIITTDAPSSTLDGKSLVETKCISCHSLDRIENQNLDVAGWKSTVERMVKKGAELTADEQTAVIEYLAKTYP